MSDVESNRMVRWIALSLAVLVGLFLVVLATSDGERGPVPSSLLGQPAPALVGDTIDGQPFSLEAERGRWVVVNFFQSNCIPCIEEHPELVEFDRRHTAIGDATLVSVVFSDTRANVEAFFDEYGGGDWPVLASNTGTSTISYGVTAAPETFVISPSGVVMSRFLGAVDADELDRELIRLAGLSA